MTRVLAGFLGTNDYVPVRYSLGERTSSECAFTQVALLEVLEEPPEDVWLFMTGAARKRNYDDNQVRSYRLLRDELAERGFSEEGGAKGTVKVVEIPDGSSDTELWGIFKKFGDLPREIHLTFDCTHGFRSLPLVASLALQYYRTLGRFDELRLLYGAFERLGTANDVRELFGRGDSVDPAPFIDLSVMLDLPVWSQAVAEWKRAGRANGLESQLRGPVASLGRLLKRDKPGELSELPAKLGLLSDSLAVIKLDEIPKAAKGVVEVLDEAIAQIGRLELDVLTPMRAVVDELKDSIEPLARLCDAESSQAYLAIGGWYLERQRFPEAATALREAVTVWCVRFAVVEAGVESFTVVDGDATKVLDAKSHKGRGKVERWMTEFAKGNIALEESWPDGAGDGVDIEDEDGARRRVLKKFSVLPDKMRALKAVSEKNQLRNKLAHGFVGHASEERLKREQNSAKLQLETALEFFLAGVELLVGDKEPDSPCSST